MKILFVCHRRPDPPARGGKIRPFNIIRHLSERHEVTVASLARSQEEADEGRGLADYCHKFLVEVISPPWDVLRMVSRLPSRTPSSMGYFYSPALARLIRAELAANCFDFIFVHCSSVAWYVEDVPNIPKMIDFGDMDSQKWLIYSKVKKFPL
ncbi:MAG: glycosyl transferase family 1, partial [Proteobacteria bacterium]|nr:glycosyl transferase family 1 [Pseudomonadota bacterium]